MCSDLAWKRARLISILAFIPSFSLLLPSAVNHGNEFATILLIPAGLSAAYSGILLLCKSHARRSVLIALVDLLLGLVELAFLIAFWAKAPSRSRMPQSLTMLASYGTVGVIVDMLIHFHYASHYLRAGLNRIKLGLGLAPSSTVCANCRCNLDADAVPRAQPDSLRGAAQTLPSPPSPTRREPSAELPRYSDDVEAEARPLLDGKSPAHGGYFA